MSNWREPFASLVLEGMYPSPVFETFELWVQSMGLQQQQSPPTWKDYLKLWWKSWKAIPPTLMPFEQWALPASSCNDFFLACSLFLLFCLFCWWVPLKLKSIKPNNTCGGRIVKEQQQLKQETEGMLKLAERKISASPLPSFFQGDLMREETVIRYLLYLVTTLKLSY